MNIGGRKMSVGELGARGHSGKKGPGIRGLFQGHTAARGMSVSSLLGPSFQTEVLKQSTSLLTAYLPVLWPLWGCPSCCRPRPVAPRLMALGLLFLWSITSGGKSFRHNIPWLPSSHEYSGALENDRKKKCFCLQARQRHLLSCYRAGRK